MAAGRPGERRAIFDAAVSFTNGGNLRAEGFRLDIPGSDISDAELGELFLRHLGLLMAGEVTIRNKRIVDEAHRGSRGTPTADRPDARRLVELSHAIEQGMTTYPGLPGPAIDEFLTREASRRNYAPGTEFSIGRIAMVGNTGTYLDSPFHRFPEGADLAGVPIERLADLEGVVVRLAGSSRRAIERAALVHYQATGRAVLLHTGWARHWRSEQYGEGHPFLSADAAAWLVEQGAALVGIDSLNLDDTDDAGRPAHTTLLRAGIPVVEHLCGLEQLPVTGFRFHAVPAPVAGMSSWPVRAYAIIA